MKSSQGGFTLVEIAIVLVIIGLLLGGVLKGQELITQAKIRNVANDINGMSAAVYGYQDRYKKFPGDDNDAATRWTNPATESGDGNGAVGAAGQADRDRLCRCGSRQRELPFLAASPPVRVRRRRLGAAGLRRRMLPAASCRRRTARSASRR